MQHEDAADRLTKVRAVVDDHVVTDHEMIHVGQGNAAVPHRAQHRLRNVTQHAVETTTDLVAVDEQTVHADGFVDLPEGKEADDADAVETHVANAIVEDLDVVEIA